MRAAYAARLDPDDPLSALEIGEQPEPQRREHWSTVSVVAASLNHHDLWSLRGVGLREHQLPMILGVDAAGVDENGNDVVIYPFIGAEGRGIGPDERKSGLSEHYPGTLAERVAVPTWNLVPKPEELTFEEAACLPTAWLTAYHMLFGCAGASPGERVLVQGVSGGVASAAIMLGARAGLEVWATSRTEEKRQLGLELGAAGTIAPGERLPVKVDAVIETVGAATWAHSLRCVKPEGTIVVAGATTGDKPPAELIRIFFTEVKVIGAMFGSKHELESLLNFLVRTGLRPLIHEVLPLERTRDGLATMLSGDFAGKIVVQP